MAFRHFEAVACSGSDDGFCVTSSTLTGNTWDGALWYFKNWNQYQYVSNLDMYSVCVNDGIADIKWYNDTMLIAGLDGGSIGAWSLVGPVKELERIEVVNTHHDDMVLCVCVTCDGQSGKNIISGGGDGRINITDIVSHQRLGNFKGHVGWVTSLGGHPVESNVFVSVGMDSDMKLWDVRDPHFVIDVVSSPCVFKQGSLQSVAWNCMDEYLIGTGSEMGYLSLYDTRNLSKLLFNIQHHTESIYQVTFSSTMKELLASASEDCSVQVFDIDQKATIYHDNSHVDFVHGISWCHDSPVFLSCSWDNTIKRHCCQSDSTTALQQSDVVNGSSKKQSTSLNGLTL